MNAKLFKVLLLLPLFLPVTIQAQQLPPWELGGFAAVVANDGPDGSDFDESVRADAFVSFQMQPNFFVETGISQSSETETGGEDNTGTYNLKVSSNDLFVGLRLLLPINDTFGFYGRGGVLYYYSEFEFEESFYDIKPAGKLEEVEEGTGFYFDAGVSFNLNTSLMLNTGLTYRVRKDYFDDSSKSFDMDELGLAFGITFKNF